MADSLMARLRARLEEIQAEMQPEAGFNRRAYGYGEDGGEDGADATFEEVALEEESPWRRPGSGSPRPVSEADRTAGGRSAARGSQAAPEPVPGRLRPKAPASFLPVGARTGGATGQDNPPPSATIPRRPGDPRGRNGAGAARPVPGPRLRARWPGNPGFRAEEPPPAKPPPAFPPAAPSPGLFSRAVPAPRGDRPAGHPAPPSARPPSLLTVRAREAVRSPPPADPAPGQQISGGGPRASPRSPPRRAGCRR